MSGGAPKRGQKTQPSDKRPKRQKEDAASSSKDGSRLSVADTELSAPSPPPPGRPWHAILIKEHWCNMILDGNKIWEIRGEPCKKRERVAIAQSRSGTLVGEATVVDCILVGVMNDEDFLVPDEDFERFIWNPDNLAKHAIDDEFVVDYPKAYAWVLEGAQRYAKPIPFEHRRGQVKWVKLWETHVAWPELETDAGGQNPQQEPEDQEEFEAEDMGMSADEQDKPVASGYPCLLEAHSACLLQDPRLAC